MGRVRTALFGMVYWMIRMTRGGASLVTWRFHHHHDELVCDRAAPYCCPPHHLKLPIGKGSNLPIQSPTRGLASTWAHVWPLGPRFWILKSIRLSRTRVPWDLTFFLFFLPSGLALSIIVNSLWVPLLTVPDTCHSQRNKRNLLCFSMIAASR